MNDGWVSAEAHPNIALIKYWGNRDNALRLPANGSISITLGGLRTTTRVRFDATLTSDLLRIDGVPASEEARARTSAVLDLIRAEGGERRFAEVESASDFPVGAGLASSASAFAALVTAACAAAGLDLAPPERSRLARRGSGSACRSIYGGFVEWKIGAGDNDSIAEPIAEPNHWQLADLVAIVSDSPKNVGSTRGHALAVTSPLQAARVEDTPRRLAVCRSAILERDFDALARVVEIDCHMMHAVMQTSTPPLLYWSPASLTVMQAVRDWRSEGIPVCYTLDAGPNVHCLAPAARVADLEGRLQSLPGVLRVLKSGVGGPARLV
jgi:diphosphomevalonate decarboxylase